MPPGLCRWHEGDEIGAPLRLYRGTVQPQWVDYNGHMSESFYLYAFGDATDALFRYIGIDEAYRAAGIRSIRSKATSTISARSPAASPCEFTTQLLGLDEKRLHLLP